MIVPNPSPFDALTAPSEDGGVLIDPPTRDWSAIIDRNRRRRANTRLSNIGFSCNETDDAPTLWTGHQPEFFHPGVWVKNVLAADVAARMNGRATCLVVDNDAPDGTTLSWPLSRDGRWMIDSLPMDWSGHGFTFEQQPPRSGDYWRSLWNRLPAALCDHDAPLKQFLDAFVAADDDDFVMRWCAGVAALDTAVGVRTPTLVRVSQLTAPHGICWSRYAAFLIGKSEALAAAYNASLAEYRAARGIRGNRHPIPDLVATADRVEVPLWAWREGLPRQRVFVSHGELFGGDERITSAVRDDSIGSDGRVAGWCIRPRALSLTMYARLFACDLFIHGLGGAKYDVIADGVIRRFFKVDPPEYACVTATLRLPLTHEPVTAEQCATARKRQRDARHNPQRVMAIAPPAERLNERAALIAESERLRREQPVQRLARRRVYERIHAMNHFLRTLDADLDERLTAECARLQVRHEDAKVARRREWFYGLHARDALRSLAERIIDS